ncbi:MAG: hypothetical protein ACYSYL_21295 [Planctomycetota bacterium]
MMAIRKTPAPSERTAECRSTTPTPCRAVGGGAGIFDADYTETTRANRSVNTKMSENPGHPACPMIGTLMGRWGGRSEIVQAGQRPGREGTTPRGTRREPRGGRARQGCRAPRPPPGGSGQDARGGASEGRRG